MTCFTYTHTHARVCVLFRLDFQSIPAHVPQYQYIHTTVPNEPHVEAPSPLHPPSRRRHSHRLDGDGHIVVVVVVVIDPERECSPITRRRRRPPRGPLKIHLDGRSARQRPFWSGGTLFKSRTRRRFPQKRPARRHRNLSSHAAAAGLFYWYRRAGGGVYTAVLLPRKVLRRRPRSSLTGCFAARTTAGNDAFDFPHPILRTCTTFTGGVGTSRGNNPAACRRGKRKGARRIRTVFVLPFYPPHDSRAFETRCYCVVCAV